MRGFSETETWNRKTGDVSIVAAVIAKMPMIRQRIEQAQDMNSFLRVVAVGQRGVRGFFFKSQLQLRIIDHSRPHRLLCGVRSPPASVCAVPLAPVSWLLLGSSVPYSAIHKLSTNGHSRSTHWASHWNPVCLAMRSNSACEYL